MEDDEFHTPIPAFPAGMSYTERDLFRSLRAVSEDMADKLSIGPGCMFSDWELFVIVARLPSTEEEMNKVHDVRRSGCTSQFVELVKAAIVEIDRKEREFKEQWNYYRETRKVPQAWVDDPSIFQVRILK